MALAFYVAHRWWQLGNGLTLKSAQNVSGVHPVLGAYTGYESTWAAGSTDIVCAIHAHNEAVTFAQIYPDGAKGTNVITQSCQGSSEGDAGCMSEPFGYFPAIDPKAGLLPRLTYFGLSGNMNEYHERGVGLVQPFHGLPSTGGYKPDGPTDSGPFVLFEEQEGGQKDTASGLHLVLSPMNNFMVFAQALGDALLGLNVSNSSSGGGGGRASGGGDNGSGRGRGVVCGAHEQQDADFAGHDILVSGQLHPYPCNSSEACCAICSQTVGCNGWVWIGPEEPQHHYRNLCYPKTIVGKGAHRVGHVTGCVGSRLCPLPAPSPAPPAPPTPGRGPLTYAAGVHFEIGSVPVGFNHTTLIWVGGTGDGGGSSSSSKSAGDWRSDGSGEGVTATVLGWGRTLRALHGRGNSGKAASLADDVTTTKLGAWTDAGTVYYRPPGSTNMQVVLAGWAQSLRNTTIYPSPIPVHYLQLDDWFYKTDETDIRCMTEFTPAQKGEKSASGFFTGGLGDVARDVGLPLHLYHACFDETTPYALHNGGKWAFDVSPGGRDGTGTHFAQVCANDSYAFYTMLWKEALAQSGGQFVGSEVDHQVDTIHYIQEHRTGYDYAQRYYEGMSRAAAETGISLQFCMSTPRHILATITLDAVTHARGSYDNHGSVEQNMAPLAFSSLFFDAVGLMPSKDNVHTLRNTQGGTHSNPQLEAVIATLSCGPVGLGDGAANADGSISPNAGTNASVILASCDANGTLLKPARPASAIDAMYGRNWNPPLHDGSPARADWPPSGVVTQTHTELPAVAVGEPEGAGGAAVAVTTSHILLVVAANRTYKLPTSQLYPPKPSSSSPTGTSFLVHKYGAQCANNSRAIQSDSGGCLSLWNPSADSSLSLHTGPKTVDPKGKGDYYPWTLLTLYPYPANSKEWLILGELDKYVALSARRWTKRAGAAFCVKGSAKDERVLVSAVDPSGVLRTTAAVLGRWDAGLRVWTGCGTFA
jgi:hypothetical protein